MHSDELDAFWSRARAAEPSLPLEAPTAWAFGATAQHADDLLNLVLAGIKTGTATAMADFGDDEPVPVVGELSIILDGSGTPRAVLEVTSLEVLPFDEVGEEHARAEGEGDRTLASWRRIHESFWRAHGSEGFAPDMPVLCERFRLIHPRSAPTP
ncbi:ASCH domain-containing protein [Brachybacterium sp. YJGR34]|uniref:ASCH domain-containing protein n=1 Tax=Brachybacterium sp. YJGR34 TaxID=2059911 RepID=UPI000E0C73DB|nr:ASCH domain-containing protein [Brachybacterium sp. YJGR34]